MDYWAVSFSNFLSGHLLSKLFLLSNITAIVITVKPELSTSFGAFNLILVNP